MGVPGNSNALEIARRLGMKEEIISDAFNMVDENKKSFDKVLKNAEELRQQYEKLIEESEEIRRRTDEEYQKAKNQNSLLVAEREKLLSGSRTEAKRIVSSAKEEATELLEQLKQLFKKQTIEESSLFAARSIIKKIDENYLKHNLPLFARYILSCLVITICNYILFLIYQHLLYGKNQNNSCRTKLCSIETF